MTNDKLLPQPAMSSSPANDWLHLRDDLLGSQRGYHPKTNLFKQNTEAAEATPASVAATARLYSDLLGTGHR